MSEELFYKPDEIADKLKISKYKLYEMIKRDEIDAYHIGKSIRISSAQFQSYIAKSKKAEASSAGISLRKNSVETLDIKEQSSALMMSELFAGLKKSARDAIFSALQPDVKHYSKEEVIVNDGDRIDYVAVVCRGKIAKSKMNSQGMQLLDVLGRSRVFGVEIVTSPSQISPLEIKSCDETSVMCFCYDRILNDKNIPEKYRIQLLENIFHILAADNANRLHKTEINSQKSLRAKILTHLYFMKEKTGSAKFAIGMDREQFARYLGSDRQ